MRPQTRKEAAIEAAANTAAGFVISWLACWIVLPLLGATPTAFKATWMTLFSTALSPWRN